MLSAIHRENGLEYEGADESKGVEIALKSHDHAFLFHQTARNNIHATYSKGELSAARMLLAPLSKDELKTKFSSPSTVFRLPNTGYARDAIACALIERGLSPKLGDISGQVYIDRNEQNFRN